MTKIESTRHRLPIRPAEVLLALLVGAVPCFAQDSPLVPLPLAADSGALTRGSPEREAREGGAQTPVASDHEMLRTYVRSTFGLKGALHATLVSSLDQWRESPPEWGTGVTGYARRWASEYAEAAIGDTAKYAVARIFHHDPSFTPCACSGFARRLRHAVDSPFMARTRDGTRVPSAASLAGVLTGHVVATSTWYPTPLSAPNGLKHTALSLVSNIGLNVLKEFRPRRSK